MPRAGRPSLHFTVAPSVPGAKRRPKEASATQIGPFIRTGLGEPPPKRGSSDGRHLGCSGAHLLFAKGCVRRPCSGGRASGRRRRARRRRRNSASTISWAPLLSPFGDSRREEGRGRDRRCPSRIGPGPSFHREPSRMRRRQRAAQAARWSLTRRRIGSPTPLYDRASGRGGGSRDRRRTRRGAAKAGQPAGGGGCGRFGGWCLRIVSLAEVDERRVASARGP